MEIQLIHVLVTVLGVLLSILLGWIGKSLSSLLSNVIELNVKMAVVVERVDGHEGRLESLERRNSA